MVIHRCNKLEKQVVADLSLSRDIFPCQKSDECGREEMEGLPLALAWIASIWKVEFPLLSAHI